MRVFILIKEFNRDFVNITVQSAKDLESQHLSEKRLVLFETLQPQRVMTKIYSAFRRSHVAGPLYAVSFDEILSFMRSDPSLQKLLIKDPPTGTLTKIICAIVLGAVGGALVLASIAWGVMSAIVIGIFATILLSKK